MGRCCQSFLIIPRHPLFGVGRCFVVVPLEGDQVVEGVDALEFAGMNKGHEEVADPGPVLGLVEERISSMQYRPLQRSFHQVMPRAGLCRVGSSTLLADRSRAFVVLVDAA